MWLITTTVAAIVATIFSVALKGKYKLGFLSLMFWGSAIMIAVDHILGYEGGAFIETETDGLISSGLTLGIVMILPILGIWIASNFIPGKKALESAE
ncbi:MAG TPA: hypothetical protein PLF16_02760 [Candidatus Staskawiczbacteria bacterium]|nr:hypothetical protein [Candidatus Staskawiczbacteria bacterium]